MKSSDLTPAYASGTFLAIDPGNDTGWATFSSSGELLACGVGAPPLGQFVAVLIEFPKVYPMRNSKGDPNDLLKVARCAGRYEERFASRGARVDYVLPLEWKGQLPKEVHHSRIHSALSTQEQAALAVCLSGVAPSKRHNAIDAVGLGKYAVRFKRWG